MEVFSDMTTEIGKVMKWACLITLIFAICVIFYYGLSDKFSDWDSVLICNTYGNNSQIAEALGYDYNNLVLTNLSFKVLNCETISDDWGNCTYAILPDIFFRDDLPNYISSDYVHCLERYRMDFWSEK